MSRGSKTRDGQEEKRPTRPNPAVDWDHLPAQNPKFKGVTPVDMVRLLLSPKKKRRAVRP